MPHPTPGLRRRHKAGCPGRKDPTRRCDCPVEASVYDASSGRKIRKTLPSYAEARSWRSDADSAIRSGALSATEIPTTVNDAAVELLAGMEDGSIRTRSGEQYKPSVVRGYSGGLRDHVLPNLGALRLAEVKRRHVQRFADRLVADGNSPSTVRNALMPLRVIYRRAIRDDLVTVNPCENVDLPANRGRRDRIVGVDTAAALIAAFPRPFDRALWATALYAGLRRGELLALRWGDVDLDGGSISVERSYDPPSRKFVTPKSRAGRRRVPITKALRRALLEHRLASELNSDSLLVFGEAGQPFGYDAALDRAQKTWMAEAVGAFICGRSVAVPLEPIGLHEARHTAASVMIAAGVNLKALSEFLGHASITTTIDRYGHLLPGSLSEAATLLDAYLDVNGAWTGAWDQESPLSVDSVSAPKP